MINTELVRFQFVCCSFFGFFVFFHQKSLDEKKWFNSVYEAGEEEGEMELNDNENPWADDEPSTTDHGPEVITEEEQIPVEEEQQQVEYNAKKFKQPGVREDDLIFAICVVDFHHIRGPEIEYWCDSKTDSTDQREQVSKYTKIWPNLPFQALPDGAHLFEETFSTFTLLYDEVLQKSPEESEIDYSNVVTLFGCACIRQLNASELVDKSNDITRSIVQKSVVMISRYPITIQLREKLSIITKSFFLQKNFNDKSVIKQLYDNVSMIYNNENTKIQNDKIDNEAYEKVVEGEILYESDFYMGLTLQEMILKYRRNLLVMFKLIMLEKRIIFFSKNLLKLSNFQFSLLSLIPNLILNLQDCGSPELENLSKEIVEPRSFNILDRGSILKFIGLPLQIFNKGGFFEPYLSLQQLDALSKLKWYLIGTSNDLLLDQKPKISDLMIHIDHQNDSLEFFDQDLEKFLQLTSQDKKFIDNLIRQVEKLKTNDEVEEGTSSIYNNLMIEDLIRSSFENYLIGLLASVKYDDYVDKASNTQLQSIQQDLQNNINQFNKKFIDLWKLTKNYEIFNIGSYNEFFTMNEFKPIHIGDGIENINIFKFINQQRDKFKTWNSTSRLSATEEVIDEENEPGKDEERKSIFQTWANWKNHA